MKKRINFYQASLKPKHDPLPLKKVLLLLGATLIICTLIALYQQWQQTKNQQSLDKTRAQHTALEQQITTLRAELKTKRDTAQLQQQLHYLHQALNAREQLTRHLQGGEHKTLMSYSALLTDLARYHQPNLWLTEINVAQQAISLTGKTTQPASIAKWLTQLRSSPYFAGKAFSTLEFDSQKSVRRFSVATEVEQISEQQP